MREAAATKPVIAIANGMSASAGYALASGATKIIAAPSGMAGSIGAVMLHLDLSRALDKEGVTPTLIIEGARKADGNPVEPLSDAALRTLQGEVHRYYELFLETVARLALIPLRHYSRRSKAPLFEATRPRPARPKTPSKACGTRSEAAEPQVSRSSGICSRRYRQ